MKITIVFILLLLFVHLNAHISIQMDEGDFLQVGDFLQTFAHGPIQSYDHSFVLRNIKKFSFLFIQMFGLMLSLLSSNLSTLKFTPLVTTSQEERLKESYNDRFENEFGCRNNVCWRSCYTEDQKESVFWCYSSPDINSNEYKSCNRDSDCASQWECLSLCQSGIKKLYNVSNDIFKKIICVFFTIFPYRRREKGSLKREIKRGNPSSHITICV